MITRKIGLALATARRTAGLTQAELAQRVGTTQSAISRAESGAAAASADLIERIARKTGSEIVIRFGEPIAAAERRRRVRRALGDYRFDPWQRNPSPEEARALEAAGFPRER